MFAFDLLNGLMQRIAIIACGIESQTHQPYIALIRPPFHSAVNGVCGIITKSKINLHLRKTARNVIIAMLAKSFLQHFGISLFLQPQSVSLRNTGIDISFQRIAIPFQHRFGISMLQIIVTAALQCKIFLGTDLRQGGSRVMHDFHILIQSGLRQHIDITAGIIVENGHHQTAPLTRIIDDQRLFQRHCIGEIGSFPNENASTLLIIHTHLLKPRNRVLASANQRARMQQQHT